MQTHRTPNGAFGVKALYEDFDHLRGNAAFHEFFYRSAAIHLRRRSKIKQAISYYFAEETGQWVSADPPRKSAVEVEYNFARISHHLRRLTLQDVVWTTILSAIKPDYMELYFEDFVKDAEGHLHKIAASIGLDVPALRVFTDLTEQSTTRSKEFYERFVLDFRNQVEEVRSHQIYKSPSGKFSFTVRSLLRGAEA